MLNNKDPRMDPCGAPNKISSKGLYDKNAKSITMNFSK